MGTFGPPQRFLGSGTFGLVSAVRKTRGADKGLVFAKKAIPKTLLVKDTNIDHLKAEKRVSLSSKRASQGQG